MQFLRKLTSTLRLSCGAVAERKCRDGLIARALRRCNGADEDELLGWPGDGWQLGNRGRLGCLANEGDVGGEGAFLQDEGLAGERRVKLADEAGERGRHFL